jgi:predicted metalloprotease with PDZ domain
MARNLIVFSLFFCSIASFGQVNYTLIYDDSSSKSVKINIQLSSAKKQINLVMPRSVPGGYQIYTYDKYLENIYAFTSSGEKLAMTKDKDDAPRWYCKDTSQEIARLEYHVNLDKMEKQQLPGDASIIRPGFAGFLDYSVFGWIDGTQEQPVQCTVKTFDSWPIFTAIHPNASPENKILKFTADNYYSLADGQIFLGPRIQVKEYKALVPLFIVSYCQVADEYLDDYAQQGIISMGILKEYFGELPFPYYSIVLRRAIPIESVNGPALAQEHLQSATFFGDTANWRTSPMTQEKMMRSIPTYLHHMAHAFIPLRCYGDAYRPYVQEIPPIINNIWFNEGFMWFLPYDTLKFERMKNAFYEDVYNTTAIIKKMSLQQLSQIASTMYGIDFRLGAAVFSRGAMMAIEMNNYIKEKTNGKKSMKDVMRYLYNWSKQNHRPFMMEEFPVLINNAAGVDLSKIYDRWQLPIN